MDTTYVRFRIVHSRGEHCGNVLSLDDVELLSSPWSLKKQKLQLAESPVGIYQSTQFHTSGDLYLRQRSWENLNPHYTFVVYVARL